MDMPVIGSTMYYVQEHFRYSGDRASPERDYCVCSGIVTAIFNKSPSEFRVVGINPNGYLRPSYFRTKEIGHRVFYSYEEASTYATQLTAMDGIINRRWCR